jgi:pimeloyl-ACP methyl ester carboxylesterase
VTADLAVRVPGEQWVVRGELLVPDGGASAVQVLLPGLAYDRRYWQVPGEYDYAGFMLRAGYAVLALDRLGTGRSSRPPADEVTVDSNVEAIHRVVQQLRREYAFDRVVAVGHGFGSGLAVAEAERHADVDALVLTGLPRAYEGVVDSLHPAAEDPILGDADLPESYLAQRPGMRARLFEHPRGVERRLSAHHELIKSTVTTGEVASLPQLPPPSDAVPVPVLLVAGDQDEYADLPGTQLIPGSGHALNLHRSAAKGFRVISEWLGPPARR